MHRFIINEAPLDLLPTLAQEYGVKSALILQHLKDCLDTDTQAIQVEGKVWIRKTYEEWQEKLPFLPIGTIKQNIYSLEEKNVILSLKMKNRKFDQGKWYTINLNYFEDIQITPRKSQEDRYKTWLENGEKHPLWVEVCKSVFEQLEDATEKKWLCDMDIVSLTGSSVHVSVPNHIVKNWVISNIYELLFQSLEKTIGYPIEKLHLEIHSPDNCGDSFSPNREEGETPPASSSSPSHIKKSNGVSA